MQRFVLSHEGVWQDDCFMGIHCGEPPVAQSGRLWVNFHGKPTHEPSVNLRRHRHRSLQCLNYPNFNSGPTNTVTSGTFGKITTGGIGGARVFQGALKFIF